VSGERKTVLIDDGHLRYPPLFKSDVSSVSSMRSGYLKQNIPNRLHPLPRSYKWSQRLPSYRQPVLLLSFYIYMIKRIYKAPFILIPLAKDETNCSHSFVMKDEHAGTVSLNWRSFSTLLLMGNGPYLINALRNLQDPSGMPEHLLVRKTCHFYPISRV
jgi:hypothetical protein